MVQRVSDTWRLRLASTFVLMAGCLMTAVSVQAQSAEEAAVNQTGFHRERSYFSPEPFEHYDTVSGNVMLTFTDLKLPANGGRFLEFQRTFSNKLPIMPAMSRPSRWSFGFPGMVMRIVEKPAPPTNLSFNDDPEQIIPTTPIFVTADGGAHVTMYSARPAANSASSMRMVISGEFYKYDRQTRTMYMPDGTICYYEDTVSPEGQPERVLREFVDPFGNRVELLRGSGMITVRQHFGGEFRDVYLEVDSSSRVRKMTFEDRTWTYEHEYVSPGGLRDITAVHMPVGPGWTFEYAPHDLTIITTPHGGRIEYTYDDIQVFTHPPNPDSYFFSHVLKFRDAYDRGGAHLGQWELHWSNPTAGSDFSLYTLIDLPDGSTVQYAHGSTAPFTSGALFTGGFGVTRRIDALEVEQLTYVAVPVVRYTSLKWFGTPELQKREITREGRKYTTEYEYAAATASFPWAFHRPTRIIETNDDGRLRTTVRTYTNSPSNPSSTTQARYILGLPATEEITVAGESFRQSWSHNTNGFRTVYKDFSRPPAYNGIRTSYTPDDYGNVKTVSEGNYTSTNYSYQWGQVSEIKTAEHTTTREVDPDSNVRSETKGGRRIEFDYDELFRVKAMRPPGGTEPTITDHVSGNGEWARTSRGSQFITTTLNGFGRPTGTINSQDVRTTIGYDEQARVVYRGYPFKDGPDIGTQIDYDVLGRIVRETHPDGSYRERVYGPDRVTLYDEEGRSTLHRTEAFGNPDESRLKWVTDAKNQTWSYEYNALGRLKTVAHPDLTLRQFEYNDQSLLWRETHPESGLTTYAYDGAGNLAQKTDANGTVQAYTYDSNNRMTKITSGTKVTEVRYEPGSDNRHWMNNGTASTNFFYDTAGRMDHRQDTVGGHVFDTRFQYDGNDRVREIIYPSNRRVQYDVDSEGQITRVFEVSDTTARDYAFGMTYHPSGALATYTAGNLVPTTLTFDDQRYRIRSITSGALQLAYNQYDALGNPREIVDARPQMSETMTYDALNRLETADSAHHSIRYEYDAHGNRQAANGSTYEYEQGTLRLSNQNGIPYTYFSNGNLRTSGGNQYTYTPENLLETAPTAGGTVTFGYDADGWRVRKTAPGDATLYARGLASEVLTELHTTATTIRVRDYVYVGNRLLSAVERVAPRFSDCGGTARPDGSPHPITIATPGGSASVPFEGSGCRRVSVLVNVTSGSLGCIWTIEIRNATTNALVGTSASSCGSTGVLEPVTLPANGDYVAIVRADNDDAGSATMRIYDLVDVATPIATNGVPVQADLLTPAQNARLPFNGTEGQRFSAWAKVASGAFGCIWTTEIRNASTNALVGTQAASCGNSGFLEPVTLPSTGEYVVVVNPESHYTGTAAVHLYNISDVVTPITPTGTPVTVDLTTPGRNTRLPFAGTQGRRMSVWVNVINGALGCIWTVEIRSATTNALIGNSSSSCNSSGFLEPVTIPADGDYVVVVNPESTYVGRATVRLYDVVDDTTAATPGSAVSVDLTVPGRNTRLPFTGTQGQRMSVLVNTTSGAFGCVWTVEIRHAVSNALVGPSRSSCNGSAFLEPVALPADGSYVVVVNPETWYTGTATVLLSAVTDFSGTITPNGPSVPLSLATPGQTARLSFSGISGRKVTATATVTSGAFGCVWYVRILNATNGVLGETGSCNANATRGPLTLPATGSYTVVVDPGEGATGNATVTLTDTP
jgi:YD repeat-containing protein